MTEEEFFINEQPLVHRVVNRLGLGQFEREDLIQMGNIGLLKAIRGFDSSQGSPFTPYAMTVIRGTIFNQLRTGQAVYIPRHVRDVIVRIKKEELEHESAAVIADKFNTTIATVENALLAIRANADKVESLNRTIDDEEETPLMDYVLQVDEDVVGYITIKDALNSLPDDLREIMYLRYVEDLSQEETAKMVGTYQTAISRKERKALRLLREMLVGYEEEVS